MKSEIPAAIADPERSKERVMLDRLLGGVKSFFNNPANLQAFEAWRNNKEEKSYGTNLINI